MKYQVFPSEETEEKTEESNLNDFEISEDEFKNAIYEIYVNDNFDYVSELTLFELLEKI